MRRREVGSYWDADSEFRIGKVGNPQIWFYPFIIPCLKSCILDATCFDLYIFSEKCDLVDNADKQLETRRTTSKPYDTSYVLLGPYTREYVPMDGAVFFT